MPGAVPPTVLPPADFNPMQTLSGTTQPMLTGTHASIIPPPGAILPPSYLPSFHFGHPELLSKNPFLPYDLANLRAVSNGRTLHLSHSITPTSMAAAVAVATGTTITSPEHLNSSRLSPASSRPSSSSPPSSGHSIKLNTSVDIHSNNGNSSEESDEEQIDVVKSAFVPILRPSQTQSIVGVADSTVQDKPVQHTHDTISQTKQRCELKAPSSRKAVHHSTQLGPQSPDTKIKSSICVQKTVWRPY